jgi:sugar phosphate isomerase/epimerase
MADMVSELAGLGFKHIELTGNVQHRENIAETLIQLQAEYGIDFLIHNYLPFEPADFVLNLATTNSDLQGKTRVLIQNAITLSRKLGKALYSIHPGFMHDLGPEQHDNFFVKIAPEPNSRDTFYHALQDIVRPMLPNNFRIAVENLAPRSSQETYSFVCTPGDIFDFLDYFEDAPNIGLLLDLAHLNIAARMRRFNKDQVLDTLLDVYLDRIFEIHVSENDGFKDFHQVSDLDSWQIQFLLENRTRLGDKNVTFEWRHSSTRETFHRFEMIKDRLADNPVA